MPLEYERNWKGTFVRKKSATSKVMVDLRF